MRYCFTISALTALLLALALPAGPAVAQSAPVTGRAGLESRADQGDPDAMYALGAQLRRTDTGNGANIARAIDLFGKAAAQNHPDAQTALGEMYLDGIGINRDPGQAFRMFRMAADQGNAQAQYRLGWMLHHGAGVPKNPREAVFWYRKAIDQKHSQAMSNLGVMYEKGEGVPRNVPEARRLMYRAANAGNVTAMYNIGILTEVAASSTGERIEAASWYGVAARRGHPKAGPKADALLEGLNQNQYQRARDLIEKRDANIRAAEGRTMVASRPPTVTAPGMTPSTESSDPAGAAAPPDPTSPTAPVPEPSERGSDAEPEMAAKEPDGPVPMPAPKPEPPEAETAMADATQPSSGPVVVFARIPTPSEE